MPSKKKRNKVIQSVLFPSLLSVGLAFFLIFNQMLIPKSIYWGAWIAGDTYDVGNPPWNPEAIDTFEEHAGKKVSILHWGQPWWHCNPGCSYQSFDLQKEQYQAVRQRGAIPLVDWASYDYDASDLLHQPEFSLSTIIKGQHDEYIRQWATEAKAWRHPFFLRFNWEMNGQWFPWSEGVNGNLPGEFVLAWRHVHNIFTEVGAQNITWVWCPNVIGLKSSNPLDRLYPGDEYVDWVCMDGYNTGIHPARSGRSWQTFEDIFTETYSALRIIAPNKPIMIAETASTEMGGSKAEWIQDTFIRALPKVFPEVKAVVWFNWNIRGIDWVIESSPAAQSAFAEGIASPYYAENKYSALEISPIPPADQVPRFPGSDYFFPGRGQ
jgi:hypothetical protein